MVSCLATETQPKITKIPQDQYYSMTSVTKYGFNGIFDFDKLQTWQIRAGYKDQRQLPRQLSGITRGPRVILVP